jgi:hypothetical protein
MDEAVRLPDFTATDLDGTPLGAAEIAARAPALLLLLRGLG